MNKKGDSVAQRAHGLVHLLGFLVRGYTMHELKALSGRESLTLVEMWDPRMEQNPWTS